MFRLVTTFSMILAVCLAQNVDPKNAKILKEQRFNAGDGRAGSAFATEDGVVFREETDQSGNRIGQYSYIGDDGVTYTVKYSAGKDGFRILSGDHIPSSGQDAAAFSADYDNEEEEIISAAPVPAPIPQRSIPVNPAPRPAPLPVQRANADPNFNPFINPNDPTHLDFSVNKNAAQFNPSSPIARQQSLVPECADCAGVNPFVNPFDASHTGGQAGLLAGHLAGFGAGQQARVSIPAPAPAPLPAPRVAPVVPTPTPQPQRFFPPGKINLNRFETGFNFDFES